MSGGTIATNGNALHSPYFGCAFGACPIFDPVLLWSCIGPGPWAKIFRHKQQLQSLLGKVNFFRTFIANYASKVQAFFVLLKVKEEKDFVCKETQQKSFEEIKAYLANPPLITPPKKERPLKLYILASDTSIRSILAHDNNKREKHAM